MREIKCPCCGQPKLIADPPARTMDERFEFEREWDRRYLEGLRDA